MRSDQTISRALLGTMLTRRSSVRKVLRSKGCRSSQDEPVWILSEIQNGCSFRCSRPNPAEPPC